jgi:hypothetical protein
MVAGIGDAIYHVGENAAISRWLKAVSMPNAEC